MNQVKPSVKELLSKRYEAKTTTRQASLKSFAPILKTALRGLKSVPLVLWVVFIMIGLIILYKISHPSLEKGMVLIPEGCFTMGAPSDDPAAKLPEKPQHEVCLASFQMDIHEVTQAEYAKVTGKQPSHFQGCPSCPVEMVSWEDANNYCTKLEKRLPTEAEWEYAARAGSKELFAWGPGFNPDYAWYSGNSKSSTQPVKTCSPNAWGIYDMSGNVWEWVNDWADNAYYNNSPRKNPKGPSDGTDKVLRGGSFNAKPNNLRHSARAWSSMTDRQSYFGFRCAK